MKVWAHIAKALEAGEPCALVSVLNVEGSAPREAGARLVLTAKGFNGTIGGGALEWRALAEAQKRMKGGRSLTRTTHALGPELGQCCGGRVELLTEVFDKTALAEARLLAEAEAAGPFTTEGRLDADHVARRIVAAAPSTTFPSPVAEQWEKVPDRADEGSSATVAGLRQRALTRPSATLSHASHGRGGKLEGSRAFEAEDGVLIEYFGEARRALYLFGAGHVGRALVLALAPLPFAIRWIDPRPDAFPSAMPGNVTPVMAANPLGEFEAAQAGTFLLIMTHSHALDLAITEQALRDERFAYVGLIGSASKRARFLSRLRQAGIQDARFAAFKCPIGLAGITSKEPAVIAAAAAAELLQQDEMLRTGRNLPATEQTPYRVGQKRGQGG